MQELKPAEGELGGRTALVTGATSDVGMAIVRVLVGAGARVHALGQREQRLRELAAAVPAGAMVPHPVDLREGAAVDRLLEAVGAIDILVFNAAHPPEAAPFLVGGLDKMRPIMEVNFFSPARFCLALLPGMVERGWGRVVAISSLAAAIGEAHGPSYCASKAALEGLLRNLAIDYSPRGVTFNAIEPGPVMTERLRRWGPTKARRFALAAAVRRVAQPEDVAQAVLFLASPRAGCITGEELRVDGGLHLGNPLAAMYVREAQAGPGNGPGGGERATAGPGSEIQPGPGSGAPRA